MRLRERAGLCCTLFNTNGREGGELRLANCRGQFEQWTRVAQGGENRLGIDHVDQFRFERAEPRAATWWFVQYRRSAWTEWGMNCVLQTVEDSLNSERAQRRGCVIDARTLLSATSAWTSGWVRSALPMGEGLRRLENCRGQF